MGDTETFLTALYITMIVASSTGRCDPIAKRTSRSTDCWTR